MVELSRVVAGAPQLITIGADKTLAIWDTISFKVMYQFLDGFKFCEMQFFLLELLCSFGMLAFPLIYFLGIVHFCFSGVAAYQTCSKTGLP